MSDIILPQGGNGEKKQEEQETEILKVVMKDGGIKITFAQGVQMALISHALRLASLEWDNSIIKNQMVRNAVKVQPVKGIVGDGIINRLRQGFGK